MLSKSRFSRNRRTELTKLLVGAAAMTLVSQASARPTPDAGWEASLSTVAHNVSGTVTVVDQDTLRFDDFTYDGGGIVVYFYLGANDSSTDFQNGLAIGNDLEGTVYDGTQSAFTVDLSPGSIVDGYHAISVWCVAVGVSFGSGTFMPPDSVPEPTTALLAMSALCLTLGSRRAPLARWRCLGVAMNNKSRRHDRCDDPTVTQIYSKQS
jgi:Electron transfer DM13